MRIPPLARVIIVFAAIIGIAAVIFYWIQSQQTDEAAAPPISVGSGAAAGDSDQTGITVQGRGSVTVAPDTAYITVGVETVADSASEASAELASISGAVVAAIEGAGIGASDILTRSLSLNPVYDRPEDDRAEPTISGYRASTTVVITVREIDRASDVLEASLAAGANVIQSVRFGLADETPLQREALAAAAQDAARKAEAMADSLGGRLGGLIWIAEDSTVLLSPERAMIPAVSSMAPAVPVQVGETTVTVSVRANFSYE